MGSAAPLSRSTIVERDKRISEIERVSDLLDTRALLAQAGYQRQFGGNDGHPWGE